MPDGDNSEVEDDEDEVENFNAQDNMSGSDDDDYGGDFVPQYEDGDEDGDEDGECSSSYVQKGKGSKTPDQTPPYRWRRITPAKVNTDFT